MHQFISEELINALGWTVLHSLWQAMLVALLMAGAMILLQKRQAKLRYHLANTGLLLVVLLAIYTFFSIYGSTPVTELSVLYTGDGQSATYPVITENTFRDIFETYFNRHMPLIVVVWFMGMVLFLLRMLGGLAYIEYLKNRFTREMPGTWQIRLELLSKKLSLKRKVQLLESALVTVPMVIGWIKPVILIPVGAINGLTMEQTEAVLAHELAHISRNDFLFNLLQTLVEVILYFNPAVWWISAVIRAERENCCDDIALNLCENRLAYAKALLVLQEQNKTRVPGMALAFSNRRKQMLNRISRILNHPQNKSKIMEKFVITSLLILALLGISMSEYRTQEDLTGERELVTATESSDVIVEKFMGTSLATLPDTLPQGKNRLIVEREDQKMEVEIEDGEIRTMKIDGKEIPANEFKNHAREVEELWNVQPEVADHVLRVEPFDGRGLRFRSGEGQNFQYFFDDKENFHFEMPDIHFDNEMFFLDDDGNNVFVLPDVDFNLPDDFAQQYKQQMEKLKLQLQENQYLSKDKLKELLERQKLIEEKYLRQLDEQTRQLDNRRIIIERDHEKMLDRQREVERAMKEKNWVIQKDALILQDGLSRGDGDVFILGRHGNSQSDMLVRRLKADGLIGNTEEYKVELSGKSLKINGKKQSSEVHGKYLKLYESLSGFEMGKKSKIVIENKE